MTKSFLALAFIAALSGCGLIRPSSNFDIESGQEAARRVEKNMGLIQHPKASPFLEELGDRLVAELGDQPFDYEFRIVDDKTPNAFAILGGHVYLSRGVLILMNNEDELAGVVGHEIIHSYKRHWVKSVQRGVVPGLLQLPGNLVGRVNKNIGNAINSPFKAMTSRHDRSHEHEADRLGIQLAAKAGYEPAQLANILQSINLMATHATGETKKFSYLDSHPMTPDRIKNINKLSRKLLPSNRPPMASSKKDFLEMFEGMLIGPDPSHGIFVKNLFIHPELNIALEFPKGWRTFNSRDAAGAQETSGEAQLILTIEGPAGDPARSADNFKKKVNNELKAKPSEERSVDFKGNKGYYMRYQETTEENEKMSLCFLWFSKGKHMYQFVGTGYDRHQAAMKEAVLTIRPLEDSDREKIKRIIYRVAEAQKGETIKTFNQRTKNVLTENLTAIINGLEMGQVLSDGQPIKIGTEKN